MAEKPFVDRARIDARDKVLGRPLFASDRSLPGMLHAMLVPARIAKGRVLEVNVTSANQIHGVVRVLTAIDFPTPVQMPGRPASPRAMADEISFFGQPIALVVAETLEAAIQGAEAVSVRYEEAPFVPVMSDLRAKEAASKPQQFGDAEAALAEAAFVVDSHYSTPTQHHNPIELFGTVAQYAEGRLTVYEGVQAATMAKNALAGALQMNPAQIDVKSPYIGGGFGQKGMPKRQTALVARAAMLIGRPVKLVSPRGQIFHLAPYRPCTEQRIRLGADAGGRFTALAYDVVQENSPGGMFSVADYHVATPRLYGIKNYAGTGTDRYVDRQGPGNMRGTHSFCSCFALESAVDEMAYTLDQDPLAIRLLNDTATDPVTGQPLSHRFLRECLEGGAERFGWKKRSHAPGSMRDADGAMIGWGVASGIFHAKRGPSEVKLRVQANGTTSVSAGGHELGQGMRAVIASIVLEGLDIDPTRLKIDIGDTAQGVQPITAGQWGTASVAPAVSAAVSQWKAEYQVLARGRALDGNVHQQLQTLNRPFLEVTGSDIPPGLPATALDAMRRGGMAMAGPEYPQATAMTYIAHFVEVRVDPGTRHIRVPRVVTVADIGRVLSPRTAKSQMHGGVVWGIGSALREATEMDPRYAGYLNDDLADYIIPVQSDIGEIDVSLLDRPDPTVSALGAKGMGELVMVGMAAAIANAVFHATGQRQRKLPIRMGDLLAHTP